jgi:wobble nucleotide-excising tRNase
MSINRLHRISGHRIFQDFSWPATLADFRRFNLIYGWNGSGKSTLGNLFRSLQMRTVITEGTVVFRIDGRDVDGKSLDTATESIRVFNADFVTDNVFTTSNRLSPIYVIGKENIEKQDRLDNLREELTKVQATLTLQRDTQRKAQKATDVNCIALARLIKEALGAHGNSYANYNKRNSRDRLEKLRTSEDQKPSQVNENERARLLAQARMPPKPRLEHTVYKVPDFTTISHFVSELTHRRIVSQVIDALKDAPATAEWVRQGLLLHSSPAGSCLFCDQSLPSGRLAQLEAHFSKELSELLTAIDAQITLLDDHTENAKLYFLPKKAEFYDDLVTDYCDIADGITALQAKIEEALAALIALLKRKKIAPFGELVDKVDPPQLDEEPLVRLKAVIDSHNEICEKFEARITAALSRLEEGYVVASLAEYTTLVANEESAQTAVSWAEVNERRLKDEIAELERDIIDHREPADELNRELRAYLGHSDLQCEVKETGYIITRKGQLAIALSDGERSAIALLYFLKTLNGRDFDKVNGVVVLDDPVSSLDSNSLFNAFAYVKDHCKDARQVILLTHNFAFFKAVREWFRNLRGPLKNERGFYMLSTRVTDSGRSSYICNIDPLLRNYESEYHFLFAYIYRLSKAPIAQRLEEYLPAPTIARRVLESFLAFRVPSEDSLHSRMEAIPCEDTVRSRIYRFVNTHAHKDGVGDQDDDMTILSETKAVLESILDFIRVADTEHHDRMIKCVLRADNKAQR